MHCTKDKITTIKFGQNIKNLILSWLGANGLARCIYIFCIDGKEENDSCLIKDPHHTREGKAKKD